MKIKANYFEKDVFPQLMQDIDAACKPFEDGFGKNCSINCTTSSRIISARTKE
jgi:hypothetical protein